MEGKGRGGELGGSLFGAVSLLTGKIFVKKFQNHIRLWFKADYIFFKSKMRK